jgi:hypothetical protein
LQWTKYPDIERLQFVGSMKWKTENDDVMEFGKVKDPRQFMRAMAIENEKDGLS